MRTRRVVVAGGEGISLRVVVATGRRVVVGGGVSRRVVVTTGRRVVVGGGVSLRVTVVHSLVLLSAV